MNDPLRIAVVGVGRIGAYHAGNVQALAGERGECVLVAVADGYADTAQRVAAKLQPNQTEPIQAFPSTAALRDAGVCDVAVIGSRTEDHEQDTLTLVDAGCRVLLEKPLTGSLETARRFCTALQADHEDAVMLAFMRRFDPALAYARSLLSAGRAGKVFKIVSVLEDPDPLPDGYQSPGILPDMAVHNIDEILWLCGTDPQTVLAIGSRLYSLGVSNGQEDFDDCLLQMWCGGGIAGQVQVSRNHVAGYRNETWIFGDQGVVRVGHFQANPLEVQVTAYARSSQAESRSFLIPDRGPDAPVFIQRFDAAYKAEVARFVECCRTDAPFPVTHRDGLRAQEVVDAGNRSMRTAAEGVKVELTR